MLQPRVYERYKRFREGREVVKDHARPGRPSTFITDENVELFITNSYHQAVQSIKSTIYKFYAICVRQSGESDLGRVRIGEVHYKVNTSTIG